MAHTYKMLEENKENIYLSTVQKSGVKVEFTIVSIWENIKAMKKQLQEIEAKVGIEKATMQNIIRNYPALVELLMGQISLGEAMAKMPEGSDYKISEKDRLAIDLFERSRRFVNEAEDKVIEFELAVKDDERSLKEACTALHIPYPVEAELKPKTGDEVAKLPIKE